MKENIPLQPGEEIRPIQGYEGLYSITSFGRVWSHERLDRLGRLIFGKFLIAKSYSADYLSVSLYKNNKLKTHRIHILVAIHFVSNLQNLPEVNHKDTNKRNNFKSNLEWCNKQYNMSHALSNGRYIHKISSKFYGISFNPSMKKLNKPWRARITCNKKEILIGLFNTEIEAAQAYNKYVVEHNLNRPLNKIKKEEK